MTIISVKEQNKIMPFALPSKENTVGSENTDADRAEVRKSSKVRQAISSVNKAVSQDFQSRLERSRAFYGNQ